MYKFRKQAAFLLFALLPVLVWAAPQGPVIGTVTLTLGDVRGVDQDGDTFEVARGTELYAGYTFETGTRSFVRARMLDGTSFTLSQNGAASLDAFSFNAATNAGSFNSTVSRGGFEYRSGLLGSRGGSRVHSLINTPSGEIGVRGTVIRAVLQTDGTLKISVPEGSISITITRSDGSRAVQALGEDAPNQNAEVTVDGQVTTLAAVDPDVQSEINVLIELVNEVEAAIDGADSSESNDDGDDQDEGLLDEETESAVEESFTAEEAVEVQLDTEAETATITQAPAGGGVTVEEEASISTLQP